MKLTHPDNSKGFTLIELMTSLSIFIIVVIISMGSILGIFDANQKSKSLKTVMSNLNLTLETMSKEIRYGWDYHCGSNGDLEEPQNCPDGDTFLSFTSSDEVPVAYRLTGTSIEKQVDEGSFVAVTAPEIIIEEFSFYTLGAGVDNLLQPKVLMLIKGRAGSGKGESEFVLQSMVSQRRVDVEEVLPYSYQSPYAYPTPIVYRDLTVSKAGSGSGTVSGPSINCGSSCSASYADSSLITLTATPDSGSSFSSWSGACSGSGTCDLVMNANKSVTATFGLSSYTIEYLIVAGGGGGGRGGLEAGWSVLDPRGGGGGGAGGVLTGSMSVTTGSAKTVTVGAGGGEGDSGSNSSLAGAGTAIGGGNGGSPWNYQASDGGSGGGAQANWLYGNGTSGQGSNGGQYAGGGGGAGANGGDNNGPGGTGVASAISGATVYYSGGGGGGNTGPSPGGSGGGGNGADAYFAVQATAGTANRGGGGGGGAHNVNGEFRGQSGGSGIVIIRYAGSQRGTGGTVTSSGGYTIHTFTSSGTFTP